MEKHSIPHVSKDYSENDWSECAKYQLIENVLISNAILCANRIFLLYW